MIKRIRISPFHTLFVALLLVVGCVKEEPFGMPRYNGLTLNLPIGFTKSPSESEIKTYRILVFSNGALISNTELSNTHNDSPITKVKVAKGMNNFYVFCNQTAELKTKIDNITNESDLENIAFSSPSVDTSVEIPMYGKVIDALVEVYTSSVSVTTGGVANTHLIINVDRLMVKLSLTFIKNIVDQADDFIIDQLKLYIHRMPKKTTIKQNQPYTSSDWAAPLTLVESGLITNNGNYTINDGQYSLNDGIDNIKFREIYIPEHILTDHTDKDQASYVLVEAIYRMKNGDGTQLRTTYTINLGQAPPTNYNIQRNNHIDIYATIRKLGEDIIAVVNLVPWNDGGIINVEQPDDMYYLNFSAAYVRYPYKLYVNKDKQFFIKDENGNYIAPLGYDYSCLFFTNRPSSTIRVTDFIMDQNPNKSVNITQSMAITEDNTIGDTHSVKGKIDISIPAKDIEEGFLKSYSMRLKSDLLDRKLVFVINDFDLIPEIIGPGFTALTDIVITNHGFSSATTTTETFHLSAYMPKGCIMSFSTNGDSRVSFTFNDITPVGADPLAPRIFKVEYTANSPRYVTLGKRDVTFLIESENKSTIYTSPFTLSLTVRKK